MRKPVKLSIDGIEITALEGERLIEVARQNGIYIPTLCYFNGMEKCLGTCRVCTIQWGRHYVAACTLAVQAGMRLTVQTEALEDLRKSLVELLFVEGNHFCPSCEKSGDCQLQALGYRLEMTVPRFHYRFNNRPIDFQLDKLLFEHNRCVLCKRCTHAFRDQEGQRVFSFNGKGSYLQVEINVERANRLNEQLIDQLVALCPVGAIIKKGTGFNRPYGTRKYDLHPIGSDAETGDG